jgi:hypothetical protein
VREPRGGTPSGQTVGGETLSTCVSPCGCVSSSMIPGNVDGGHPENRSGTLLAAVQNDRLIATFTCHAVPSPLILTVQHDRGGEHLYRHPKCNKTGSDASDSPPKKHDCRNTCSVTTPSYPERTYQQGNHISRNHHSQTEPSPKTIPRP